MTVNNNNVLVCPFCLVKPDTTDPDWCHPITRPDINGDRVWAANCSVSWGGCGDVSVMGDTEKHAISNWQRREKR